MDRIELYCGCGGHLHAEATGHEAALFVKRSFWEYHIGPGHYEVTRDQWLEMHSGLGYYGTADTSCPVLAEDLMHAW